MFKKLLITLLLTFFSTQASAYIFKDFVPANISKIHVDIVDHAKEGCWTNIGEVKRYTEDKLRLAGFNVPMDNFVGYEEKQHYVFVITITSQRNAGLCFGSIEIDITRATAVDLVFGMFSLGGGSSIFSGMQNVNRGALDIVGSFMEKAADP